MLTRSRTCFLIALLLLVPCVLAPATIVVEGDCTLVDAITAANTDRAAGGCPAGSGADEILLTGNVTLTAVDNYSDGYNGLPSIISDVTVVGRGFSIERDDTAESFRIFHVAVDGILMLQSTTVSNGYSFAWFGYDGGAIYSAGSLTLLKTRIEGSTTNTDGGGIHNSGVAVLVNSTVSGNDANGSGGGISNRSGQAILIESTIEGNTSWDWGGGILSLLESELLILKSTISGNQTGDTYVSSGAGGVFSGVSSTLLMSNSTVSHNEAVEGYYGHISTGGGLVIGSGDLVLNTTVADNTADSSAGIEGYGAVLSNSILARNSGWGTSCFGIVDGGNNFADEDLCPGFAPMSGLHPSLADNGGPTRTHTLMAGSPAIDAAGDCDLDTDQRGMLRADGDCDSGAFEYRALELTLSGECPGELDLAIRRAAPGGEVRLAWSETAG